jgi:two-component system sensor histidine kinase BaeS
VSVRTRLAIAFALVALGTALAVAATSPYIVGRGFARLQAGVDGGSGSQGGPGNGGQGQGQGGPGNGGQGQGIHADEVQRETVLSIVVVSLAAAGIATLVGVVVAGRLTRPLRRLEAAAESVAAGDLGRRSGLADRPDELGSLGRSFDGMAQALADADETRRRFLQDAVHELRTPLTVIETTSSAILDGVYGSESRHLETVRDQARLLSRIVDDLRTISLAEGGALPLEHERIEVRALLQTVAGAFGARAAERGIRLAVEPTGSTPSVVGDRDRLRQALGAVIDNALRHTPAGGTIQLAAHGPTDGFVRLEVGDSGPGFGPEDLPHVFDRFYQADRGRDRSTGTSGLGLAIVRALVEAHGGRVGAADRPDGGAVVWLELPADAASAPG